MIYFEEDDFALSPALKKLAKDAEQATLEFCHFPYESDVTLTVTDNTYIHTLNKEHRGIDRPTDVLSFPMVDWPKPMDYQFLEEHIDAYINPETDYVLLGDIVLSIDKVKEQAESYGHSFEREFAFLIAHSLLHLLGFDHETPEEEKEMFDNQKAIMTILELPRDE